MLSVSLNPKSITISGLWSVVFCTSFKLYWDVVHDFGFTVKFWELRPTLLYPRKAQFRRPENTVPARIRA